MISNSTFKQELLLREYGRNVQNIVQYILTVPDKAERTRLSQLLVNLMAKLNPQVRDIQDNQQKLWNHLFVMSDGKLDVDAPFPLSAMDYLNDKPQPMDYLLDEPKFKHYGKNVENLIQRAATLEDDTERTNAIISIGKLMKTLYRTYNKENITDDVILSNIRELSNGRLNMDLAQIEQYNLFEPGGGRQQSSYSQQSNYQQNNKKRYQQDNQNRRKSNR
ncbi:MAG: DUF4290 domain-containing protein [Hymenobacteraceae bacterium]|nr:DUF4290 domain-containing protein [Hymenobacteraceae bacterium]MDX5394680.1 DUF4290 domain-containing protein [Hymenobacteraceae bacterium]MDX5442355.1 DUF4290 domain-containing protein [Hymenobacteraceae bacterium]MDX5510711.1 DUF4290 domain-containing protein [Hymenobacteraceae bacterium]